ncbi:MAG: dTDP-4-dehydrorhamnose 3,5-epimerase [Bacteroidetes bacterium]|jgi:dTDP-4-dehydrorhamnose 3,5-epimerase|nr:dTDP-4-dehydrorhamnose 3,5-epimerase [Bacteroidota bacterium]
MEIIKEPLPGLLVIKPRVHGDARGYFMESYQKEMAAGLGIQDEFVQDNESMSDRGVLRGLHYQTGVHAQSKWVRVVTGSVWDVAVDLRINSPTYGQYFGMTLSEENKLQMYIPRGFAHGFVVLSSRTIFCYKCDNYYNRAAEAGIRFDDESLGISWPDAAQSYIISEKDKNWPTLEDARSSKTPYE